MPFGDIEYDELPLIYPYHHHPGAPLSAFLLQNALKAAYQHANQYSAMVGLHQSQPAIDNWQPSDTSIAGTIASPGTTWTTLIEFENIILPPAATRVKAIAYIRLQQDQGTLNARLQAQTTNGTDTGTTVTRTIEELNKDQNYTQFSSDNPYIKKLSLGVDISAATPDDQFATVRLQGYYVDAVPTALALELLSFSCWYETTET